MSDLEVCRICLRAQCKVYKYDHFDLKAYYEELVAQKMTEEDGLPLYFCYECATVLHKFHKFKEKCWLGLKVLKQIQISCKGDISYEAVGNVDRAVFNLKSSLEILTTTERVKTFNVLDKKAKVKTESESVKMDHCNGEDESDNEDKITLQDLQMIDNDDACNYNYDSDTHLEVIKYLNIEINNPASPTERKKDNEKKEVKMEFKAEVNEIEIDVKGNANAGSPNDPATQIEILKDNRKKNNKTNCKIKNEQYGQDFKIDIKVKRMGCPKTVFVDVKNDVALFHNKTTKEEIKRRITRKKSFSNNIKKTNLDKEKAANKECQLKAQQDHYKNALFKCTVCCRGFARKYGLKRHKLLIHKELMDEDEDDNTFCDKCDIHFETRKAFVEHFFHSAKHIADTTHFIENTEDKGKTIKNLTKRTKELIIRQLLGRRPPKRSNLKKKNKEPLKKPKKPTTCNQCGKYFDTQLACWKHHRKEHPGTPFYSERHICEICGASLAEGSINLHRKIHNRQKPFPCDLCDLRFHNLGSKKRHMLSHTGEKPYACSLCDKRFTQSNSRKLHYNTFHLKQPYPKRNRRKCKDDVSPEEQDDQ